MPTMRDRFSTVTTQLLEEDPSLALVLADIGADRFARALRDHPRRAFNVGIREQTLIGVASGLALEGMRPIAHSYAPFLIERPFEQLKIDFGHQGVGGIFVSVGASYDWAAGGRTHQAPADVALVSTLPDWHVHVPGHPDEVESLLRQAAQSDGSHYIRLSDRMNSRPEPVESNEFVVLRQDPEAMATIVAIGPSLAPTLAATSDYKVNLLYAATVRPFDAETLRAVVQTPKVVLIEPYLVGTSVAEVSRSLEDRPHQILAHGVPKEEHRHYGTASDYDEAFGLDEQGIRERVGRFVRDLG